MPKTTIAPLTPERWPDLVALFGERGACGGCWCMWPHRTNREFEARKGAANRRTLQRRVRAGKVPGVLAYRDGEAVGWCAVEPRRDYARLERSRILAPVDDADVWSILCLFVRKDRRRAGVTRALVDGAVAHARAHGARIVEAYPIDPRRPDVPDVFAFHGLLSTFTKLHFREVARRSPTRPIVRRQLRPVRRSG